MKPWTMGFTGALPNDLSRWVDRQIEDHEVNICVPFLGSAKAVTMFAREHRYIEAWDTQYLLKCLAEGIWHKKEPELNVGDKPAMKKGYVYEEKPFKGISDESAGLIDWICDNATQYEKVALATTIARCTYRGRLGEWSGADPAKVWKIFNKRIEYQKNYLALPGKIEFHMENFYEADLNEKVYDVFYVDPPKIVSTTDAYSSTYERLNRAIGATDDDFVEFDRWTRYDYVGRMRQLFEATNWSRMIFIYTSDVRPNLLELKEVIGEYGELVNETRAKHRSRMDYGLVYERR